MSRKIYYSEGRRIKEGGVEKGEETRRYRRRRVGGALAKERRREGGRNRDDVRALSRRAFFTFVDYLLFIIMIDFSTCEIFFTST
jgi:hypothetical protein